MEHDTLHWDHLHDATFESLEFDWPAGVIKLRMRLCTREPQTAEIIATGFSLFQCPRQLPWGYSASVNEANGPEPGTRGRLELELQSGDTIEIEAERLDIRLTSGAR
jgi:hypothetical protein